MLFQFPFFSICAYPIFLVLEIFLKQVLFSLDYPFLGLLFTELDIDLQVGLSIFNFKIDFIVVSWKRVLRLYLYYQKK